MKKHLIIASYDGINCHYCGVGTIIRNTIFSLRDIVEKKKIKVSLACVSADPKGKVFDNGVFKDALHLVRKTGGHLIPLCNGTAGFDEGDMWKSFPQWKAACASLATALNIILSDSDDNVLMLHDTPFLLFSQFKQQIFGKRLRAYYLPHSSGINHAFGDNEWRKQRITLEKTAFKAIQSDRSSKVLATGLNFGRHLTKDYSVRFSDKNYLTNGLHFERHRKFLRARFDAETLRRFGINIEPQSKIIFSWGRCSIAKGFQELLEAWKNIVALLPNHYLIIQAPNNSGETSYSKRLKNYANTIPRTHIIDAFNPEIWQTILRTRNTDVVCIPSLMDPNPHTAIEAKLFCIGMNYVIVASNLDGIKDSYSSDECIWVNPYNRRSFANRLIKATSLGTPEKMAMIGVNRMNLFKFDYKSNVKNFLNQIRFL